MTNRITTVAGYALAAGLVAMAPAALTAQEGPTRVEDYQPPATESELVVLGQVPADLSSFPEGPDIEGFISAREGNRIQITSPGGQTTVVSISAGTDIKATGGFLGLDRDAMNADQLVNGLPVEAKTVSWNQGLVASELKLKAKDLKTARIVQNGTSQQFAQQGAAIGENKLATERNAAATEALRGRFGDIDNYSVTGVTNVYFDTGRHNLSSEARMKLCDIAEQAESTDNALLLVVGYTDSTGSQEVNQALSEKRAGSVVNYLQQQCKWKPWRMLSPTGMAEADPAADNSTPEGKAQNRRVAVNILVSKSVEGL